MFYGHLEILMRKMLDTWLSLMLFDSWMSLISPEVVVIDVNIGDGCI
jgi:hypothetical protein